MQRCEISTDAWRARVSVLPGSELHLEMEMADVRCVDPPVRARDRARMRWSRSNVVPVGAVGDIVICAFDTSVTAGTVKHTVSVLTGRARPGHGLAVAVRDVPRARQGLPRSGVNGRSLV